MNLLSVIGLFSVMLFLSGCATTSPTARKNPAPSAIDPEGKLTNDERAALWRKDHPPELTEDEKDAQERQAERDAITARRNYFLTAHADLPAARRQAITEGSVTVGMAPDEVEASWGPPDRIIESGGIGAQTLTWIFRDRYAPKTSYLYFVSGALARWSIDT